MMEKPCVSEGKKLILSNNKNQYFFVCLIELPVVLAELNM